jgi:hypothetical protein
MIVLFSLISTLFAKDMSHQRAQMLLQGKHLTKRYDSLKNKQEAWLERKKILIERFNATHDTQTDFGDKNRYGTQREKRRTSEFYASLEKREEEISKELSALAEELAELKETFSNLFGVPMTRKEMFGGRAPKVVDKKRKVRLLREYINAKRSWVRCLRAVDRFDDKRIALELQSNLNERRYNALSQKLDKKVEKNYKSLNHFEEKSMQVLDTYALDYGYSIPDEGAAKVLLENIEHAY